MTGLKRGAGQLDLEVSSAPRTHFAMDVVVSQKQAKIHSLPLPVDEDV
jgi:hypothetical protein